MAFRLSSKTISMSPGFPRQRLVPPSPISPAKSAFVVEKLERAGAIVIGKTNLDQFATGLVGVRSPYGVPRNALRAGSHTWRIELRLGDGGRRGPCPVFAWHRHRGIGPRAGGVQRHCGAQAVAWRSLHVRRRPRLPNARHHLGLCPRCRRRLHGLSGGLRIRRRGRLQPLVPSPCPFGLPERVSAGRSPPGSTPVLR